MFGALKVAPSFLWKRCFDSDPDGWCKEPEHKQLSLANKPVVGVGNKLQIIWEKNLRFWPLSNETLLDGWHGYTFLLLCIFSETFQNESEGARMCHCLKVMVFSSSNVFFFLSEHSKMWAIANKLNWETPISENKKAHLRISLNFTAL